MIINTDVLEHIPKSDIADVLNHIKSLSNNVFFCLHHAKLGLFYRMEKTLI